MTVFACGHKHGSSIALSWNFFIFTGAPPTATLELELAKAAYRDINVYLFMARLWKVIYLGFFWNTRAFAASEYVALCEVVSSLQDLKIPGRVGA